MNVDDVVRERIERARLKAEAEKLRRAELAAARRRGLAARHAQKLRALAERGLDLVPRDHLNNSSPAASGA
ncbi:hypothetical protein OH768_44220 [Streptomyces sp. NBC_01622]|uniref:hypothetical protein n=1 Tax=Streptomyces sp. NBC_01622 TaxID=2975903 RepID=UPI00386640A2|nr:hypothetical protein OH768_44220 [Streptomyces sp. NBC_01622]